MFRNKKIFQKIKTLKMRAAFLIRSHEMKKRFEIDSFNLKSINFN